MSEKMTAKEFADGVISEAKELGFDVSVTVDAVFASTCVTEVPTFEDLYKYISGIPSPHHVTHVPKVWNGMGNSSYKYVMFIYDTPYRVSIVRFRNSCNYAEFATFCFSDNTVQIYKVVNGCFDYKGSREYPIDSKITSKILFEVLGEDGACTNNLLNLLLCNK